MEARSTTQCNAANARGSRDTSIWKDLTKRGDVGGLNCLNSLRLDEMTWAARTHEAKKKGK